MRYRCQLVEDDEILFSGLMDTSNIKMNFKSAFVELKLTDVLGVMTENDESLELEDDEPIIKTIEELIEVLLRKLINIGSSDFEGDEIGTSIDYPDIPLLEDSVYDLLTVDWDSWVAPADFLGEGNVYYSLSETSVDTIQLEIFKVWFNDNLGVAYVRRETYEIYPTTYVFSSEEFTVQETFSSEDDVIEWIEDIWGEITNVHELTVSDKTYTINSDGLLTLDGNIYPELFVLPEETPVWDVMKGVLSIGLMYLTVLPDSTIALKPKFRETPIAIMDNVIDLEIEAFNIDESTLLDNIEVFRLYDCIKEELYSGIQQLSPNKYSLRMYGNKPEIGDVIRVENIKMKVSEVPSWTKGQVFELKAWDV